MPYKLHQSFADGVAQLGKLDNLYLESDIPLYTDDSLTIVLPNPVALELNVLADIRVTSRPTLTINDINGNEYYSGSPLIIETLSPAGAKIIEWRDINSKPNFTGWATKAFTNGSTTDVAEGSNQYFTNAKVKAYGDTVYPQLSVQYTNPTWLAGIDASTIKTGTIDLARLPAMPSANTIVCTTIPAMSAGDQLLVAKGTVVIESTTGNTYRYSGSGSVILNASYIQQSDMTPDWAVITNRPTNVSTWTNDAGYLTAASSLAWAKLTGVPATFAPSAHTHLWADLTDKPSTFTPSAHTHALADVYNCGNYIAAPTVYEGIWPSGVTKNDFNFALLWNKDNTALVFNSINEHSFQTTNGSLRTARFTITPTLAYFDASVDVRVNKLTANMLVRSDTSKNLISYTLVASDIPNLDASKITTGTFLDARIASSTTWNAKQAGSSVLTSIATLSTGTGLVKLTNGTASLDTSTYATTTQLGAYLPIANPTFTGILTGPTILASEMVRVVKAGSNTVGAGAYFGAFWDPTTYRGSFFQLNANSGLSLYVGNTAQPAWVNTVSFNVDGSITLGTDAGFGLHGDGHNLYIKSTSQGNTSTGLLPLTTVTANNPIIGRSDYRFYGVYAGVGDFDSLVVSGNSTFAGTTTIGSTWKLFETSPYNSTQLNIGFSSTTVMTLNNSLSVGMNGSLSVASVLTVSGPASVQGNNLRYYTTDGTNNNTGYAGIYPSGVTWGANTFAFLAHTTNTSTFLNASSSLELQITNGSTRSTVIQVLSNGINANQTILANQGMTLMGGKLLFGGSVSMGVPNSVVKAYNVGGTNLASAVAISLNYLNVITPASTQTYYYIPATATVGTTIDILLYGTGSGPVGSRVYANTSGTAIISYNDALVAFVGASSASRYLKLVWDGSYWVNCK